jgi:hypothetical protein
MATDDESAIMNVKNLPKDRKDVNINVSNESEDEEDDGATPNDVPGDSPAYGIG